MYYIGVDIGGTFTDCVLVDREGNHRRITGLTGRMPIRRCRGRGRRRECDQAEEAEKGAEQKDGDGFHHDLHRR